MTVKTLTRILMNISNRNLFAVYSNIILYMYNL